MYVGWRGHQLGGEVQRSGREVRGESKVGKSWESWCE